ncbi:MAG: hypothetical protein V3575_01010 [Candidatus Absconditabacteria bacterium]
MVKLIESIKKGMGLGLGISVMISLFVVGLLVVRGAWQSSNPTAGLGDPTNLYSSGEDTLTKEKWNALVQEVQTLKSNNDNTPCPTGFINLANNGESLGCIQKDVNPSSLCQSAILYCYDNFGGRLPSMSELTVAKLRYSSDLLNYTGWEFIDVGQRSSQAPGSLCGILRDSTLSYRPGGARAVTENTIYRCFLPR